jgi:hypothetical protein
VRTGRDYVCHPAVICETTTTREEENAGDGRQPPPRDVIQKVEHESRIHIDIESDDLEAEVTRLERLGARRLRLVKRWWLMQAPTGHVFCVTDRQRPLAGKPDTNEWR